MALMPKFQVGVIPFYSVRNKQAAFLPNQLSPVLWFAVMGAAALAFSTGYAKYVVDLWVRACHVGTKALLLFGLHS